MKPFHDWSVELPKMLDRQEPESSQLEYKRKDALLPSGKTNREQRAQEISKDVSAFLNSNGGTIVYGIRENPVGKQRYPAPFDPQQDGFTPLEMSKEDLERLITSNIQNRPSPSLFCITPVMISNRYVFVVDIAKSYQGVFQAKDRKYYQRFNFESVPMEHYEVEDVRRRAISPDLMITLGFTDTWETTVSRILE